MSCKASWSRALCCENKNHILKVTVDTSAHRMFLNASSVTVANLSPGSCWRPRPVWCSAWQPVFVNAATAGRERPTRSELLQVESCLLHCGWEASERRGEERRGEERRGEERREGRGEERRGEERRGEERRGEERRGEERRGEERRGEVSELVFMDQ